MQRSAPLRCCALLLAVAPLLPLTHPQEVLYQKIKFAKPPVEPREGQQRHPFLLMYYSLTAKKI
jgi:hypothetical protein